MPDPSENQYLRRSKAYLIGGGVASIAAAIYLIRDGGFSGGNILLLEQDGVEGGCLDGSGSPLHGYVCRGGRLFEPHYECTFDVFSGIPSINVPDRSVTEDIHLFNNEVVSDARSRLRKDGEKIDVSSYGLSLCHRLKMLRLMLCGNRRIGMKIEDWFPQSFFSTNFWLLWTTTFSFQPWDNVDELRRYFLRFIHMLPGFNELKGVLRTRYNQYDSMILPAVKWLKKQGVRFETAACIDDIGFDRHGKETAVTSFTYRSGGSRRDIAVGEDDFVFITLGSMVENSSRGSMNAAPPELQPKPDGSWPLWEKIAAGRPDFGRPDSFSTRIPLTDWVSFTVTQKDPWFFDFMEKLTGNRAGTGGLVSFVDSNWFMSIVLFHQPHFFTQPEDDYVFWGYGLFPDNIGNHVQKKMSQCTGQEILTEMLYHLKIQDMQPVISQSNCIPTMMPYITSQFLTRQKGDRPAVVPKGAVNFAFIGQFCEMPDDVVFTVEYSVRSAGAAVYSLLELDKKMPPVYKGQHHIKVLWDAFRALMR